jgi:beta-lactamase regulating signal transducer with metallopeptidase domain
MIGAIFDHLWQSTVLALAAGLLTLALRKAGAPVRFGVWLAASLKFLLPFAALAALGGWLAPEVRPPTDATPGAILIAQAVQPFSQPHAAAPAIQALSPEAHPAPHLDWALVLAAIWTLGCIAVLATWMIRWSRVRRAVRQATPLALPGPMPVLASSWTREPGLVGLVRPVLLVPDTLPDHLSRAEIEALVAHEACHLRRRDNLTAAIHMLVQAVFWFHPLVWWIGGRLIEERERACDEAVVKAGHDRAAYARSLVECCRLYLQSPLPCVAGASGSNLRQRVEMIMTSPPLAPLSRSRKTLLMAAGVCALATPVAAGWLTSPAGHDAVTQAAAAASGAPPVQVADARLALPASGAESSDADAAPATIEAPVQPSAASAQSADAAPAAPPPPPAPLADLDAPKLALSAVSGVQLSRASLIPVSDRTSDGGQPLGPGHYVQSSGIKKSADCSVDSDVGAEWHKLSTPPIAPGHTITNFHYELRGQNGCDPQHQWESASAKCELATDKADRKTVRFQLFTNRNDCLSFQSSVRDGPQLGNAGASGSITQPGAVTQSEMMFSYDVQ